MHQAEPSSESKPVEPSVSPAPKAVEERAVERRVTPVVRATQSVAQSLSTGTPVMQRTVTRDHEVRQREVRRPEPTIMEREVASIPEEPSALGRQMRTAAESTRPAHVTPSRAVIGSTVVDSPAPAPLRASTVLSRPVEVGEAIDAAPTIQSALADGLVERSAATVNPITQVVEEQVAVREFVHKPQSSQRGAPARRPGAKAVPGAQAHYGWLKALLQGHVERMKQYPQRAFDRKLEGRVVVRAVMWSDGTLTDLEVLHSSGHDILDDEALQLLTRLSPVSLTHDLGRESITVKIPITYGIE